MKKLLMGILATLTVFTCAAGCSLPSLGGLTSGASSSESKTESIDESTDASADESVDVSADENTDESTNDSSSDEPETFTLTLRNGNPMVDGTMEELSLVAGATLDLPTLEADGKNFLGWFDIDGNAAPAVMPAESIALYANWEVIPYTLTIVNGEESTDFTFAVEYTNDIFISVNDLAYVLEDNLPEGYTWAEEIPETFALQNYTFTAVKLYSLTLRNGNPMVDGTMEELSLVAGAELALPTLEADGKNFLGWFDIDGNAAPAVMPVESIALYANWEVIPYTLTIVNGEESTDFTFAVEYTNDILISVNDLAYVLEDNLPANTIETIYSYTEEIPEAFTLQNYTFTVAATEAPKYALTLRNGNPMMGGTMEILEVYAGAALELTELTETGKKFLGWYSMDENDQPTVAAPAVMPAEPIALYAVWEVTPYTLTIKQDGAEDKTFTFAVEYTNDILISVNDLAYVLEDNLPLNTTTAAYEYKEAMPSAFTAQDYTFTIASISILTIPEANNLGKQFASNTYSSDEYLVSGTVVNVANTTYGNLWIADENGNLFYTYGAKLADGTKYEAMDNKPVFGDVITLRSAIGSYDGCPQMKNAVVYAHSTPETIADIYKAIADSFSVSVAEKITEACDITLTTASTNTTITWTSRNTSIASINGDKATFTLPVDATQVILTATFTCGTASYSKEYIVAVAAKPASGETTVNVTFGTTELKGTQYADETYVINENLTISSHNKGCHFTTQLRIYDSDSNDGWAILTCTGAISAFGINMGYKKCDLLVYGSTDGEAWEEAGTITSTSTTFLDYDLDIDESKGYTYLKIDASGAQLRIKSLWVTMIH